MVDSGRFTSKKPELSAELSSELDQLSAEKQYRFLKFNAEETTKSLAELSEKVKGVEGFWTAVLNAHPGVAIYLASSSDQEALSYLSQIELKQDTADPRPYEIIFHFKENPFFSNATLSKKYSLPKEIKPIKEGKVTKEDMDYDPLELVSSSTKIEWKSDEKNLCKKYPRNNDSDDADDFEGDPGTFFHFFADDADPFQIGHHLQDAILPDAYLWFTGEAVDSDDDEGFDELDDEDEEDDDEGSIDLEEDEPKKKKQRK